jgi:hypothetical protein
MARGGPVIIEDRREREEDREQRLAALRIRLQDAAQEVRTAEDWATSLRAAARLPGENWAKAAETIRQITGNKQLTTVDEQMRPAENPELPEIARALPADTAYQITRTAERLGFIDYSDVLAEVANAVIRQAARPKGDPHDAAPRLARSSFPHPALAVQVGAEPATTRLGRPGNRQRRARIKRLPSS